MNKHSDNNAAKERTYTMPLRYRSMENLHIVFWLFKDIAWCMLWRPLGILMIIPTLFIAIRLSIRNRHDMNDLCHNLAVVFWITANSYWMISEFFGFDEKIIFSGIMGKQLALIPFSMGVMVLAWFYMWWKPKNRDPENLPVL